MKAEAQSDASKIQKLNYEPSIGSIVMKLD